jgi:hypothetical protein
MTVWGNACTVADAAVAPALVNDAPEATISKTKTGVRSGFKRKARALAPKDTVSSKGRKEISASTKLVASNTVASSNTVVATSKALATIVRKILYGDCFVCGQFVFSSVLQVFACCCE